MPGYATTLRNNRLAQVAAAADAGATGANIRLYTAPRPATGGATTTLLAEGTMSTTAFGTPSGGAMTANAITRETSAPATGTAAWFRIVDSNGTFVMDGSVSALGGGGELQLGSTTINAGVEVRFDSLTVTEGNP